MKNKYELLAPIGDFPNLHSAIKAGCDAVYLGLKEFNMRDSAKNFSIKDLQKVSKICKQNKIKIYLTLNTIIYDNEIKKLEKIIKKVKPFVNAIICWDLSTIQLCRKYKIPFHISTQASVSNTKSAEFYKKLGAERIILARELNLKQIKKISTAMKNKLEIECFCHGAMCVSVSGRCFASQFLQGLSANRGQCSHPCRRSWKIIDEEGHELKLQNKRVMSAKDLCTLPFIEKMKKARIKSFKIEGRGRSPEYVYNVVKEYRKALDKKLTPQEIKQAIKNLKKVYNRGFSSGFYIKMPTSDDFSKSEHGEQKEKKKFIGKIEKYWPRANAVSLKVFNNGLKQGSEVYIISTKTGIIKTKIKSIEKNKKQVKTISKGQDVGVVFETKQKPSKGDEVYLIEEKT